MSIRETFKYLDIEQYTPTHYIDQKEASRVIKTFLVKRKWKGIFSKSMKYRGSRALRERFVIEYISE